MNRTRKLKYFLVMSALAVCVFPSSMQAQQKPPGKVQLTVKKIAQLGTRRFRHGGIIRKLWFGPDGQVISAGGLKLRVWNSDSGELASEVPCPTYFRVYFDGETRALVAQPRKNGVPTHTFRVVNALTGEQIAQWNSPRWVEKAAIGRDADFAVLGNLNRTVSIVDLKTGEERDQIDYLGPKSKEAWRPT